MLISYFPIPASKALNRYRIGSSWRKSDMKITRVAFVVLSALALSGGAAAQSPCSRVGQIICDSRSGMEMRCQQTASQITPIISHVPR
jgi:hypothetical protein